MRAPAPPAFLPPLHLRSRPRFACVPGPPAFPARLRSRLTASRSISMAATSPSPPALFRFTCVPAPSPLRCYPTRGGGAFVPNCLSFEGYVRLFVL